MIISVASGKGGTGKTTVSVNLALSLEKKVQILDCDVEEPNVHLFMKTEMTHVRRAETPVPDIDMEKCTLCKKCAEICQFSAIVVIAETVLTFPELCHSCGGCMKVCPENAIVEKGRELGVIERGRQDNIELIYGKLRIGEAMSPPLIEQVRTYADPGGLTIIDAPPGTSCPVISAMKGADFILLVTEPTPFGLHDLKLAVEAVKVLGIPRGLIINRAGMGDDRVKEYAEEEDLPILMEIPFDRRIAEAYSRGKSIVEVMPELKEKFRRLYGQIEMLAGEAESRS